MTAKPLLNLRRVIALALSLAVGSFTIARAETTSIRSPNGTMVADVFKPSGPGPFPVVVFSHGRSGDPAERSNMHHPLREQYVSYWTQKGFALVAPIRPGYGLTGGFDVESSGSNNCTVLPNYNRTAGQAANAIVATVDWVRQQAWAKPNKILLVGQSVGGLGTVAAAARSPEGVVGYINFAGGSGGDPKLTPGASCHPEVLQDVYANLGSSNRLPGLWFYAANDKFWGPDQPKAWGAVFNAAGGHATLNFTGPSGSDGHHLMTDSPGLWQGKVDQFIHARGL